MADMEIFYDDLIIINLYCRHSSYQKREHMAYLYWNNEITSQGFAELPKAGMILRV